MKSLKTILLATLILVIFSIKVFSQDAAAIIKKSHLAFFYAGNTFKANVKMVLTDKSGKKRERNLVMLRKDDADLGNQKFYIYFSFPTDVKGTSFLVYKYPNTDDKRYLFIPAVNMVKRIAANDSQQSFVGSDFTYEDISGRDLSADKYTLLKDSNVQGKTCYVVQNTPVSSSQYSKKISYIDKKNYLPLKEEFYDQKGKLFKVFTANSIKNVNGIATIVSRTMKNLKNEHSTTVTFTNTKYNLPLSNNIFSESSLKKPPLEVMK